MNDILTQQMKEVFKSCDKEGLDRILIYLEEFKDKEKVVQSTFKRDDIPILKIWIESYKNKQRLKGKKEERLWNFVFLLVGAVISATVVLLTTKAQLSNMEEQRKATMQQQEKAIKMTFENGFSLMLLQYKTESELRFLKEIYDCIENDFDPLFPVIHNMRNNWKEKLVSDGKAKWFNKLDDIRLQISNSIKKFDRTLKKNSHHKEIYDIFYKSMSFQSKYSNPITDLRVDIERFPENFTVANLKVLDSRGKDFSEAVNVLHRWIEDTKKKSQDMQQEIYKKAEETIKEK